MQSSQKSLKVGTPDPFFARGWDLGTRLPHLQHFDALDRLGMAPWGHLPMMHPAFLNVAC